MSRIGSLVALAAMVLLSSSACGPRGAERDAGAEDAGTVQDDSGIVMAVPGAPAAPTATPGESQVALQWMPPAETGSSAIVGYVVQWQGGAQPVGSAQTELVVSGLTNGQVYAFTVTAVNAAGPGPASPPSADVSPGAAPEAPAQVVAVGGEQAVITWTAPNSRGRPITAYTVTASSGAIVTTTGATTAYFALASGTYTFTVTATNELGTSAPSLPSNQVTLDVHLPAVPIAPRAVATATGALVRWAPPRGAGGVPTGYVVSSLPPGVTASTEGATEVALSGLTEGINYKFKVRATNSAGEGEPSIDSNAVMFSRSVMLCSANVLLGGPPDPLLVTEPIGVASGQFDGDGRLDLFVIDANVLYVARGRGDGTFEPRALFTPSPNLTSIAVGDLNGDSSSDVVLTSSTAGLSISFGDGQGGLGAARLYPTGTSPSFVVIAHLDANTSPDLAVLYGDSVGIFLNDGTGSFPAMGRYPAAGSSSIAVADFNGDGVRDLAVSNGGELRPLLGAADGTFQWGPALTTGTSFNSMTAADFDGDGDADLFGASSSQSSGYLLLGNGDATFSGASLTDSGGGRFVTSADLDGSGAADLAILRADDLLSIFSANGSGSLQPAVEHAVGYLPVWATPGDFNGDGVSDLAIANRGNSASSTPLGTVTLFLGTPGVIVPSRATILGQYYLPAFVADDFNVDGHLDLAVTQQFGVGDYQLKLLHGTGTGTFQPPVVATTVYNPTAMRSGDFDRDGIPDLAVTGITTGGQIINVSVHRGDADGGFQLVGAYPGNGSGPYSLTVDDFNADGILDLAVATKNYFGVDVYLGGPGGAFAAGRRLIVGGAPGAIVSADFNRDDKADLATANELGNSVSVLLGVGDGTFASKQDFPAGTTPVALAVAELNGDGVPDLVTANQGSRSVSVLLGLATGGFANAVTTNVGTTPSGVAIADVTLDGHEDVLVSLANYRVALLKGNGAGALAAPVSYAAAGSANAITTGQFDGDGRPDVAVIVNRGTALLPNVCAP